MKTIEQNNSGPVESEKAVQVGKKVKEADLYSAFIEVPYTPRRSGTDHTVLPANYTVPASTS